MLKKKRTLVLSRETIRALMPAELRGAAGGVPNITDGCPARSEVCPSGTLWATCGGTQLPSACVNCDA